MKTYTEVENILKEKVLVEINTDDLYKYWGNLFSDIIIDITRAGVVTTTKFDKLFESEQEIDFAKLILFDVAIEMALSSTYDSGFEKKHLNIVNDLMESDDFTEDIEYRKNVSGEPYSEILNYVQDVFLIKGINTKHNLYSDRIVRLLTKHVLLITYYNNKYMEVK